MKSRSCVFNGFLALVALVLFAGCGTTEERQHKKELSSLRIHIESDQNSDHSSAVPVMRSAPMMINIEREPVLTENHVRAAMVIDQQGVLSIQIQFNRQGSWILERTSVMNKGRRLVIFGQFDQARWLGAPLITGKNSSGVLTFTPDATREETERFVRGLNNMAHKIERHENWPFPHAIDE